MADQDPTSSTPSQLLHGVRILDFTSVGSGPVSTRYLCDLGAEVIKIESPGGDPARLIRPLRAGKSTVYGTLNCGKKSVVLDLKFKPAIDAALALAAKSDVVVENWRPGTAARLGLGYEQIASIKPNIIYCSLSGYGQSGPKAGHAAYAGVIHAMSGYDRSQMEIEQADRPPKTGIMLADFLVGYWGFSGILAAYIHHQRTGRGQYIDVSMLDAMFNLLVVELQVAQFGANDARPHVALRASDGFITVLPLNGKNYEALTRVLGRPELLDDVRFNSNQGRRVNWFELLRLIEDWTSTHSAAECEKRFNDAGVPCGRIRSVSEVMDDPHTLQRGLLRKVQDAAGEFLVAHAPFQMPGLDIAPRGSVSDIGENTAEVLGSVLGYDEKQISACR